MKDLAILSEAVVVARVGDVSPQTARDKGSVALWIERTLKGELTGGRDIVWVPKKELPGASVGGPLWLLFLSQLGDRSWHVQTGERSENLIALKGPGDPVIAEVAKFVGSFGPAAVPEAPAPEQVLGWLRQAVRGDAETRREAIAKILAAGSGARDSLLAAQADADREMAAEARRLAPLTIGGRAANNLRLGLAGGTGRVLELHIEEIQYLGVSYANLGPRPMNLVTGVSAWGDNVEAAAAFELRLGEDGRVGERLASHLPANYGAAGGLPVVRSIPGYGALPAAVKVSVEKAVISGKERLQLKFPHGDIDLPGPGKYSLRVRFEGPGPRPDQKRLIDDNYWGGGQLVSNEIVLVVKVAP